MSAEMEETSRKRALRLLVKLKSVELKLDNALSLVMLDYAVRDFQPVSVPAHEY